jgi:hypothetical protein
MGHRLKEYRAVMRISGWPSAMEMKRLRGLKREKRPRAIHKKCHMMMLQPLRMRFPMLIFGALWLLVVITVSYCPVQAENGGSPPTSAGIPVRTAMRNVDFYFTDRIAVHIAVLDGTLKTNYGSMPVFDDKKSFDLNVAFANIIMTMDSLTNDLNDYVFTKPDAPLKKLSVTAQSENLVMKE